MTSNPEGAIRASSRHQAGEGGGDAPTETHCGVVPANISRGVRFAFQR